MSESYFVEVLKQIITPITGVLVTALIGEKAVKDKEKTEEQNTKRVYSVRTAAGLLVIVIIAFWISRSSSSEVPTLQRIEANPNLVGKGQRVTIKVRLDRPAIQPILVSLNSDDPAILTVDDSVTVESGAQEATSYASVRDVPNYPSPVKIFANYNGVPREAKVNVSPGPTPISRSITAKPHESTSPSTPDSNQKKAVASAPPAIPPELLGRWEEASSQLTAEKSYWNNVKQNMPAGTSLRPEITSQIFAAESAGRRCENAKNGSDVATLSACVDALNDHLTQLKIQH